MGTACLHHINYYDGPLVHTYIYLYGGQPKRTLLTIMMDRSSTLKLTYRSRTTGPKTQPKLKTNEFMPITIEDEMKFTKILTA